MRSIALPLLLATLGLALGCSSSPRQPERVAPPQSSLPDCEQTNGYPPCIYRGDVPDDGPYDSGGGYYPAYDYPYYPGTGVIVVPVPVPVPVPTPTPKPKPPKHPTPPSKHHRRPIVNPCHPQPGRPCP
jgi:hypothetical protein